MCSQPLGVPLASFSVHRNKKTSSSLFKGWCRFLINLRMPMLLYAGLPVMWDR